MCSVFLVCASAARFASAPRRWFALVSVCTKMLSPSIFGFLWRQTFRESVVEETLNELVFFPSWSPLRYTYRALKRKSHIKSREEECVQVKSRSIGNIMHRECKVRLSCPMRGAVKSWITIIVKIIIIVKEKGSHNPGAKLRERESAVEFIHKNVESCFGENELKVWNVNRRTECVCCKTGKRDTNIDFKPEKKKTISSTESRKTTKKTKPAGSALSTSLKNLNQWNFQPKKEG